MPLHRHPVRISEGPFVELGFGVSMSLRRLMVQLWMAAGTGVSRNPETDVVDDLYEPRTTAWSKRLTIMV